MHGKYPLRSPLPLTLAKHSIVCFKAKYRQNKKQNVAINAEMGVSAARVLGTAWLLLSLGAWEQHGEDEDVPHQSLQTGNLWLIPQSFPFLPGEKITTSYLAARKKRELLSVSMPAQACGREAVFSRAQLMPGLTRVCVSWQVGFDPHPPMRAPGLPSSLASIPGGKP